MRADDAARSAHEDGRVARVGSEGERLKVGACAERQPDVTHGVPVTVELTSVAPTPLSARNPVLPFCVLTILA
jgi:hypothetical protein